MWNQQDFDFYHQRNLRLYLSKPTMTVREWQEKYAAGGAEAVKSCWRDISWHTKNIAKHTEAVNSVISRLVDGGKIDLDETYIVLKNATLLHICSKRYAGTYDTIYFCHAKTRELLWKMTLDEPQNCFEEEIRGKWHIWNHNGYHDCFSHPDPPQASCKTAVAMAKWLNQAA